MGIKKHMGLTERKTKLISAIEDFKKNPDFNDKIIKRYEKQLSEVEAEIKDIKDKRVAWT